MAAAARHDTQYPFVTGLGSERVVPDNAVQWLLLSALSVLTLLMLCVTAHVVSQAGFGADIGLEKFMNIKCRASGLKPNAAGGRCMRLPICSGVRVKRSRCHTYSQRLGMMPAWQ